MKKKININAAPKSSENNHTGGWRTFKPEVSEKCLACGRCSLVCPEGAIEIKKINGKTKARINYDYCKGCALCVQECPTKAIIMKRDVK